MKFSENIYINKYNYCSDMSCLAILKVVSVCWWVTHFALLIYILFSVTEMLAFSCCLCLLVKLLIILKPVLWQVYRLFHSEFSLQCDVVFPLSVSTVLLFPCCIQCLLMSYSLSSYYFYPFFYLSFSNMFWKAVPMQNVTNPVILPSVYCTQGIPCPLNSM